MDMSGRSLLLAGSILLIILVGIIGLLFVIGTKLRPASKSTGYLFFTLTAVIALILAVAATMYFLRVVLRLHVAYWLVPVFGGLGGLVGCLMRNDNQLPLVTFDRNEISMRLGFVGDVILGLGGASAVVFLFENTLKFNPEDKNSYPLLISICFVAGVFGSRVIQQAGDRIAKEALSRAKDAQKGIAGIATSTAMTYVLESREQYMSHRYSEALASAKKALEQDPLNVRAMNAMARALKKLDRVEEAFSTINEALKLPREEDPGSLENYGVLLYNRVCYGLILGRLTSAEAVSELRRSFELFPRLRQIAKTDSDLEVLRQEPQFQQLVDK